MSHMFKHWLEDISSPTTGRISSSNFPVNTYDIDTKNFEILTEEHYVVYGTDYLLLEVRYHDCTTYEGRKLLLFRGPKTSRTIIKTNGGELDPHFQPNVYYSPVARFRPDEIGWRLARLLMRM